MPGGVLTQSPIFLIIPVIFPTTPTTHMDCSSPGILRQSPFSGQLLQKDLQSLNFAPSHPLQYFDNLWLWRLSKMTLSHISSFFNFLNKSSTTFHNTNLTWYSKISLTSGFTSPLPSCFQKQAIDHLPSPTTKWDFISFWGILKCFRLWILNFSLTVKAFLQGLPQWSPRKDAKDRSNFYFFLGPQAST